MWEHLLAARLEESPMRNSEASRDFCCKRLSWTWPCTWLSVHSWGSSPRLPVWFAGYEDFLRADEQLGLGFSSKEPETGSSDVSLALCSCCSLSPVKVQEDSLRFSLISEVHIVRALYQARWDATDCLNQQVSVSAAMPYSTKREAMIWHHKSL